MTLEFSFRSSSHKVRLEQNPPRSDVYGAGVNQIGGDSRRSALIQENPGE